jgi:hypothetical protein
MSFSTNQNIQILNNLLRDYKAYEGLPQTHEMHQKIQNIFNKNFSIVSQKNNSNIPVVEMNKKFLQLMANDVRRLREEYSRQQTYEGMKQDLSSYDAPTPAPVNFSEPEDKPITNLDEAVKQKIKERDQGVKLAPPTNIKQNTNFAHLKKEQQHKQPGLLSSSGTDAGLSNNNPNLEKILEELFNLRNDVSNMFSKLNNKVDEVLYVLQNNDTNSNANQSQEAEEL